MSKSIIDRPTGNKFAHKVSETSQNKQYFHMLSALRGVAAILIVLRHTTAFWTFKFPMSHMAVDVFFLLSGVVLEANYRKRLLGNLTPLHFLWIRVARIYPLYILGTFFTLFTIFIAPNHQLLNGLDVYAIPHRLLSIFLSLLLLPNLIASDPAEFPFDHPAWSLFFEMSVNFVYAFIAVKLTTKRATLLTISCGVGLILSLLYFHHVELGWIRKTIPGGVFRTGFSFFLGILLYRAKSIYGSRFAVIGRRSGGLQWLVIAGTMFILMAPVPHRYELFAYIISVFFLFPVIVFIALLLEPREKTRSFFDFLGDVSYPVYTLQVPFYFFLCTIIFPSIGVPVDSVSHWFGYVFLAGLVVISYGLDRVFDRPAQKFLRSLWKEHKLR